jgi:uncharacterized protein HemY
LNRRDCTQPLFSNFDYRSYRICNLILTRFLIWLVILILIWLLILIVRDFRRPTEAAREWWREAGRRASELGHGGP